MVYRGRRPPRRWSGSSATSASPSRRTFSGATRTSCPAGCGNGSSSPWRSPAGPTLVIADEPTTALDVTTQAQILRLLEELQAERRVATLFVTHDLGVVAHLAHRVGVMYAGCLVESAPTADLFRSAAHPYTQGLLAQVLRADVRAEASAALDGLMPVLAAPPGACPFRERCPKRMSICDETMPRLRAVAPAHSVACHLHEGA